MLHVVCKKLINEHCSIIPVPSCSLGLIYSVKDCFRAAAGWGIYLWPANLQLSCSPPIFTFLYFLNTKTRLNIRTQYSLWQELRRYSALQYPIYQKCRYNSGLELQLARYLQTDQSHGGKFCSELSGLGSLAFSWKWSCRFEFTSHWLCKLSAVLICTEVLLYLMFCSSALVFSTVFAVKI